MKFLVATHANPEDAFDAEEGELVVPESCKCCTLELGEVFRGLESEGHTITARIVERDDVDLKAFMLRAAASHEGHVGIARLADDETEMRRVVRPLCRMIERAEEIEAGSIVRRDRLKLRVLKASEAAS